jgi:hypothetical protein
LELVVTALVLCALGGCAKKDVQPPPVEALKAVLDGQELQVDSRRIRISQENISAFEVTDLALGPGGKTATAVLRLVYDDSGQSYEVEGVVSYERSGAEDFKSPRFELSEIRQSD